MSRVEIVSERCQAPPVRFSGTLIAGCGAVSRSPRTGSLADVTDGETTCAECGRRALIVIEVHHEKCADPLRHGCRCPASWPRRLGEEGVKHVRGGNCWVGVRDGDVCYEHDEPRGEFSECPRCPACDLEPLS